MRKRKERMSEGKKNIIAALLKEYDIQSAEDIRDALKDLLGGTIESSKYWLSVLNELKNRGVKDILILCADGLTGIKESINVAFPNTEYQRCIVHQM